MKALRYENQKLSVIDVDKPDADGEALVRVTLSGICNTDLEITRGYAGFQGTIGHEFVGVIESLPEPGAVARRSGRAPIPKPSSRPLPFQISSRPPSWIPVTKMP